MALLALARKLRPRQLPVPISDQRPQCVVGADTRNAIHTLVSRLLLTPRDCSKTFVLPTSIFRCAQCTFILDICNCFDDTWTQVRQTRGFGKILLIDDDLMLTERDEASYLL